MIYHQILRNNSSANVQSTVGRRNIWSKTKLLFETLFSVIFVRSRSAGRMRNLTSSFIFQLLCYLSPLTRRTKWTQFYFQVSHASVIRRKHACKSKLCNTKLIETLHLLESNFFICLADRVLKCISAQTMPSFGLYFPWINKRCIIARVKFKSSEVKFLFSVFKFVCLFVRFFLFLFSFFSSFCLLVLTAV